MKFKVDDIPLYNFFMQALLSLLVFLFCMSTYFLNERRSRGVDPFIAGLLASTVAYWLPSPGSQFKKSVNVDSEQTNIFPPPENQ